jgi:hypothetical protein
VPGRGDLYVVQLTAVADPSPPYYSEAPDPAPEIDRLLARLRDQTEAELIDQVYRQDIFHLCGSCYHRWIDHPFGE